MQLRRVYAGRKCSDKAAETDDAAFSKFSPGDGIRAICASVSLGSIKPADLPPGAMRAAVASVKDGSAVGQHATLVRLRLAYRDDAPIIASRTRWSALISHLHCNQES